MYTQYIDKLYETIRDTQYYEGINQLQEFELAMEKIVNLFTKVKKAGNKLFFIGNGGSAAIATHMTADFMKNGNIRTCSLFDSAVITCMGNDYGYQDIFSRPLAFLGEQGDLLIAISSSGNSANIVNAIQEARNKGMTVLTLSGFLPDNKIKNMGDFNIYVPVTHYGMVESIHITLLQQMVDVIYDRDNIGEAAFHI